MISIIIPVHNAEHTLPHCVACILKLNFSDYELILVNDGSTDRSAEICDEFARKDSRITVIHQLNSGAGAARNAGLDIARGTYILFCDADDCYDSAVLDDFLASIPGKYSAYTLPCFDFRNVWPSGIEDKGKYLPNTVSLSEDTARFHFLSSKTAHDIIGYSVWNKLYSRQIIERYNIRMPEHSRVNNKDDWAEDLIFNLQYLSAAREIVATGHPVYLLTKHMDVGKETETAVAGRTEHMLNMFSYLYKVSAVQNNPTYLGCFWEIGVWHICRFLYADAQTMGIKRLREICTRSKNREMLFCWIDAACMRRSSMLKRWKKTDALDYLYLLKYIRNGNLLLYKLRSYWLWKIQPSVHRLLGK